MVIAKKSKLTKKPVVGKKQAGPKSPKTAEDKSKPSKPVVEAEPEKAVQKHENAKDRRLKLRKIKERAEAFRKAHRAKNAIVKSKTKQKKGKVRTSVTFRRPHTLRLSRQPKYPRSLERPFAKVDEFSVIKHPIATELCMKKLESDNTLTFIVDSKATKRSVVKAILARYSVKVAKVTTLNIHGVKKAYVRLRAEVDAIEVANKIGIL
ncbi:60S ribosomal protein L23a [Thelohanellus kitauei]|uniref:60S ribosomal protein L23a n=1 Tax=Thelohanellus kitauei TaxID=669202 RepID=A0A0C2J037_THEKT|nr:60S ribosomal protein L23a [Thelohanellus kitauei]